MLTKSFWLQFNFFYLGELAYDPFAAHFAKGKTSMCIIANGDGATSGPQLKKLLHNESGGSLCCGNLHIQDSSAHNKSMGARD